MKSLGRMFAAAKPEAVVIATPHNVHIAGALGVVVSSRVAGQLDGAPSSVALDCPTDADLAWRVLASYLEAEIPSVGISFGSNDQSSAVAPMDWGVLIPLWFMGGRSDPPIPVVVVTPARDLPPTAHFEAGRAIARAAEDSGRRVAFIASADHGQAHSADGPYGFDEKARVYDELVCDIVQRDDMQRLIDVEPQLVERAKADSWWQMLMLAGATADGWRDQLEAVKDELGLVVGQQQAVATIGSAAHAAPELVQLRKPEAFRALDHHHGRIRHIDTNLDHCGRHQDIDVAHHKALHHGVLIGHASVHQVEPQVGNNILAEARPLGCG